MFDCQSFLFYKATAVLITLDFLGGLRAYSLLQNSTQAFSFFMSASSGTVHKKILVILQVVLVLLIVFISCIYLAWCLLLQSVPKIIAVIWMITIPLGFNFNIFVAMFRCRSL